MSHSDKDCNAEDYSDVDYSAEGYNVEDLDDMAAYQVLGDHQGIYALHYAFH